MNTVKIDLCGLPDELRSGLEELCMHEGFRSGTGGNTALSPPGRSLFRRVRRTDPAGGIL